jgi:hypothetical protein
MSCYVHNVPGRLRIKIDRLKNKPGDSRRIKRLFTGLYGIDEVKTNEITGSITVRYDSDVFCSDQILNILRYNEIIGANQRVFFEKPVSKESTKAGMAVSKAVISWAVGRALEGSGLGFLAVFI